MDSECMIARASHRGLCAGSHRTRALGGRQKQGHAHRREQNRSKVGAFTVFCRSKLLCCFVLPRFRRVLVLAFVAKC